MQIAWRRQKGKSRRIRSAGSWLGKRDKDESRDRSGAAERTELFVEFRCGPANAKVKGSVMTNLPVEQSGDDVRTRNSLPKTANRNRNTITQATGEKVKDVLLSKIGGPAAELEQAGQTITNSQTDEEALEINRTSNSDKTVAGGVVREARCWKRRALPAPLRGVRSSA